MRASGGAVNARRAMDARGDEVVFFGEIKEAVRQLDFIHAPHRQRVVPEHRAADLESLDRLLQNHLAVVPEGLRDRLGQRAGVGHLGDTEG